MNCCTRRKHVDDNLFIIILYQVSQVQMIESSTDTLHFPLVFILSLGENGFIIWVIRFIFRPKRDYIISKCVPWYEQKLLFSHPLFILSKMYKTH